ncbi:hypothetical protein K435DRAFT_875175 [Dendrothele bispora CBS 962.96]|uniref:Uncharacterized protein n=1 Tax=Dendrothele bispora (strain CBS 962.96) TaxID=1314807 RepID=A0A4S8KUW3_DENBC|nr:hypothetical protein K435DRAFT_875175 [Dendrothele bispora CBS 962.96]
MADSDEAMDHIQAQYAAEMTTDQQGQVICQRKNCPSPVYPAGTRLQYMPNINTSLPGKWLCPPCYMHKLGNPNTVARASTALISSMLGVVVGDQEEEPTVVLHPIHPRKTTLTRVTTQDLTVVQPGTHVRGTFVLCEVFDPGIASIGDGIAIF